MKRDLVVGKVNVGKTMFCVNFAKFLGLRYVDWMVERADGQLEQRRMSFADARSTLSDADAHRTRNLQSVRLTLPRGKGTRDFLLTDSTGLIDGIHPDGELREAMARTLRALCETDIVLHMVDAEAIGAAAERYGNKNWHQHDVWTNLDEQIVAFGAEKQGYLMLANKIDRPLAKRGYKLLAERVSRHQVIPVSALHGNGFREVKRHVWRLV